MRPRHLSVLVAGAFVRWDFEPPEDFLYSTVVHMMRDDNCAFVQTRWTFTNSSSLLTWAQRVGLDFHFAVEQRARSFLQAACQQ